jgi:hypothetical protein
MLFDPRDMGLAKGAIMRYLVVANQTLNTKPLENMVRLRIEEGQTDFHIVVPATAPADQATPVEGGAIEIAEERLRRAEARFRALGAENVSGEVGLADPFEAIREALGRNGAMALILATLPSRLSLWLRQDLPNRLRKEFPDLLIEHLEVDYYGSPW